MSKHKIRYILPLLVVMTSAVCVGAVGSSDKAANAVKPKQEKNLCPEPVDQMDEDCLRLTSREFEGKLNTNIKIYLGVMTPKTKNCTVYPNSILQASAQNGGLSGQTPCDDPTVTTDLKNHRRMSFLYVLY